MNQEGVQRAQSSSSKRQKPNASAIARHRVRREITCRIKKFDAKLHRSYEYCNGNNESSFVIRTADVMRTRYAHQFVQLRVPGRRTQRGRRSKKRKEKKLCHSLASAALTLR